MASTKIAHRKLHHVPTFVHYRRAIIDHWHKVAATAAYVVLGVVFLQMVYPRSMALPQTYIGGRSFGWRTQTVIDREIASLNQKALRLQSGELVFTPKLEETGLRVQGGAELKQALGYSWQERLVPFSFFLERREVPRLGQTVDHAAAQTFAASLAKHNRPPVNARVRLKGTTVTIEKSKPGYRYDQTRLVTNLQNLKLDFALTASLMPEVVEPDISDKIATDAGRILHQRLSVPLSIEGAGALLGVDKARIASWTRLQPDAKQKKVHIVYDRVRIKQSLAPLASKIYRPATHHTVTLRDGVPISGSGGKNGRMLALDATTDAVIAAINAGKPKVQAVIQPVVSGHHAIRTYTRSSRGIQALLNHWQQSNGGTYGVVMRDVTGKISASINPDYQFTSASTYKMYVAFVVFTKVKNNQMSLNQPTSAGLTVSDCMVPMIVYSTNPCGIALGNMIGWSQSHGLLRAKGFNRTMLVSGAHLTTARDAATYMTLVHGGRLTGTYDQTLLSLFGRQVWRSGIPAGSPGMHVADKIGFYGGFHHDAGIVYHPKGTYILTIMTYGSSFSQIRSLASQVANVMSQ